MNNFIYFFLWSWAGGILRILQSHWFRELAVFYFIHRPWLILGKTVPSVLVFCSLWRAIWNDSLRFSILDSRRTRTPLYFCQKEHLFTWAQYVVWTYKIKFNNLASLWVYFLSRSISFEEWNFFLPPVCIALAVPPLSFLSNGFLYHFSTFWIHQKNVKTWGE